MSHTFVSAGLLFVPVQKIPGPVLVTTTSKVEFATSLEINPLAPCGRIRFVIVPEPPIAPTYLMSAVVPTLIAPATLMVFVPFNLKVPQWRNGPLELLAGLIPKPIVAPSPVAPPKVVRLLIVEVALPSGVRESVAAFDTAAPPRSTGVVVRPIAPPLT